METHHRDTLSRVAWRLLPFMMLLYFIAFIDRVNVSLAKFQMNGPLGITPFLYGLGSGAFFLGYFLFEVPSNLLMHRVGARRWICRIMISWGIVSAAMALAVGPVSYTALRVLLGVAEAGFFPGMILYLTYWFPAATRGKMTALFVAAIPISSAIGAPLSTWVMQVNGAWGLAGWQWLFILEGLPAVLVGLLVPLGLTDKPADARWLTAEQRRWLQEKLDQESVAKPHTLLRAALVHPAVLTLCCIYFCLMVGLYVLSFWMPSILKDQLKFSDLEAGLIAAIPYAAGAMAMIPWGRHSDRTGEREWHAAIAMGVAAGGCLLIAATNNAIVVTAGFSLLSMGVFGAMASFWPMPSARLKGTAVAGGIALVNSVGNLGGFLGPTLIGGIKDLGFGYAGGLITTAGFSVLGAVLVVVTKRNAPAAVNESAALLR